MFQNMNYCSATLGKHERQITLAQEKTF
jgi:hypothetical protein